MERREHREHSAEEKASSSGPALPKKWWQWLLIYPGLAVGLIGSTPTLVEAARSYDFGVAFGRSTEAQEQNDLWTQNFDCAQKANFVTITTNRQIEIGSFVCDSGDVLLRGKRPESNTEQLRWVSWRQIVADDKGKTKTALELIFPSAHASETLTFVAAQTPPAPTPVVCQKWVGRGQLLQRIRTPQGCVDQVINTYNGTILSRRGVPCNPAC
jgi:hypothetical protein